MKRIFAMIIIVMLMGCATIPNRKVVYVQKTTKQNLIDFGMVLVGAGIIVGGYAIIMKKQSEAIKEAIANQPPLPIPVVTITW